MAMPQKDNYIEQIHRLEGLMAYEGERRSWGVEELGVGEWFDGLLIVFEGRPRGRPLLYREAPFGLTERGFLLFGRDGADAFRLFPVSRRAAASL